MALTVACPTCRKTVVWNEDSRYRPFCSKRCQLIDLGEWANEEKAIPVSGESASPTLDIEDIEARLAKEPDNFFTH